MILGMFDSFELKNGWICGGKPWTPAYILKGVLHLYGILLNIFKERR